MTITPFLFEAFLKCPTKCWLRFTGEPAAGNTYAEWVETEQESYRADAAKRLIANGPAGQCVVAPDAENLKTATWAVAVDVPMSIELRGIQGQQGQTSPAEESQSLLASAATIVESRLHAVERIPLEGRGKAAQFIAIRFIFTKKLSKDDKLLLAFDAFVLAEMLGRGASLGKIVHGDDHATLKVKTSALVGEVRKRLETIATLLANPAPPDLVLNRHCAECEFRDCCRKIAVEKDDLSLLANMGAKERQKLRNKGIFTVTQLSYTFRPRRRPKRLRNKPEKYHHSLKALAIREKRIHIVGSPKFKVEGTPVYLDVEGLPDRDFYYLIGVRIGNGESAVQHSLWADTVEEEGKIWREFLGVLETVEKPVLIHYGRYETNFMTQMKDRHGGISTGSTTAAKAIEASLNALSFIFGRIYFPTFSNGLKEIARFFGFGWSDPNATGTTTISLRNEWVVSGRSCAKEQLLVYNEEDCTALQRVVEFLTSFRSNGDQKPDANDQNIVNTEDLPRETSGYFRVNQFQIPELGEINKAAYWDYQRERIFVKTNKRHKQAQRQSAQRNPEPRANKIVEWPAPPACPKCSETKIYKHAATSKTVLDLRFSSSGVKRWVTRFDFYRFRCTGCKAVFHNPKRSWSAEKFGRNLRAFIVYQIIELRLPQETAAAFLSRLFGFNLCRGTANKIKVAAAEFYQPTYNGLLKRIVAGPLVHADETKVDFKDRIGYIWTFTNVEEVAFVFADSRESVVVQSVLKNFKGVLVSDFYTAYDSIECPQQKCLIHLIRDLNDGLMAEPFNEEMKKLVAAFTRLLRPIIATVDRYGLKRRFLRKHCADVDRFYKTLHDLDLQSEMARKCKTRLARNRDSLFTFLEHDGVPWNNNNAEHAIKSFVLLRRVIAGSTTEKGIREYLVLLSVCQTCKYMGVDFLDFLRSGEKDVHAFSESRRRRRRQTQGRQAIGQPTIREAAMTNGERPASNVQL